jgi:hypothetical protein
MRNSVLLLLLIGLLVGCAPSETEQSVMLTAAPTPTETIAPTMSKAPVPTVTETPTLTPFPTATPLAYPIISTPQDAPNLAQMDVDQWLETSPDGRWQAAGMVAWPQGDNYEYHEILTVSRSGGSPEWVLVDAWHMSGLGAAFPAPVRWSQDGQYFYFSNQVTPDGCALFGSRSVDLYKLELATGEVQVLLSGNYFGLSLSPNERLVAAIKQVTREFTILDLDTGEEIAVDIDPGVDYAAGAVVWSPQGDQLALTLAIQPCNGDYAEPGLFAVSSSIMLVDAQSGEAQTLIEDDDRKFETVAWDDLDWITLRDKESTLWLLNMETGELIQQK